MLVILLVFPSAAAAAEADAEVAGEYAVEDATRSSTAPSCGSSNDHDFESIVAKTLENLPLELAAIVTPHVMNSLIMVISDLILHQIPWLIHFQVKLKEFQIDFNLKSLWESQKIPNFRIPNPYL
jgi:hypothetical protein